MSARLLIGIALAAAVALAASAPASPGHECDRLDVCISVTGPWVVVRAEAPTYYQVRCPRQNMVVAGLDALVSDRGVKLEFLGTLGSPIIPGVATSSAVVFVATYTGAKGGPASFRPLVGCVPRSGGGRGTTSVTAPAAPPAAPTRRVRTFRLLRPGAGVLREGCRRGEHLVSSSAALAFRRKEAPGDELIGAVRLERRNRGNQVLVSTRVAQSLPSGTRAEVQIHAVCGRAS